MDSLKRNDDSRKIFRHCFSSRDSSDKYLKSLQAYWGENDISRYINRYLATGKFEPEMKVGIF